MIIVSLAAIILTFMYGAMSLMAGLIGYIKKSIPVWSAVAITIIGAIITVSSLFIFSYPKLLILLVTSLILMQVLALVNGYHMYGKINFRHHIMRLIVSIIIIVLYII